MNSHVMGRFAAVGFWALASLAWAGAPALPAPAVDIPASSVKGPQKAVFAGGCFWGVEAVFRHVKGVESAVSGYAGGMVVKPSYEQVGTGKTGHAESVEVIFDPSKITYGQLLRIYFSVAHDPTQLNGQGPDVGTSYRSAIFYTNDEQKRLAQAYIAQLDQQKVFPKKIVTEVTPLKAFYRAEDYHQDYAYYNPDNPYIQVCDRPKIDALKQQFPDLFVEYKPKK